MVGITGSLAAGNVKPDCDIDFMILTEAGAMWRTRALAIASALVDQRLGTGKLCPNFVLSMRRSRSSAAACMTLMNCRN